MARWVGVLLLGCLGCQSLPSSGEADTPEFLRAQDGEPANAESFLAARSASKGRPLPALRATHIPRQSAEVHMSAAELLLERGDTSAAAEHLAAYVAQRPEHLTARAQLAELLFRDKNWEESRRHFERFIEEAQPHADLANQHILHSHARLAVIAQACDDPYGEQLHRGIGMYLLARRVQERGSSPDLPSAESLLYRAAEALQQAREEAPDEARPHYYLYQVWNELGQQKAALHSLSACDAHAAVSPLTPKERQELLNVVWQQKR